jgi:cytochrome c
MKRFQKRFIISLLAALSLAAHACATELRGHGGPVRALALAPDGLTLLSGSFDQSAILWSLHHASAEKVLRGHSGSVNAVLFLPDGRFVTAGEDGKILLWSENGAAFSVLATHDAAVSNLALSPDQTHLASASWDGTALLIPLAGGTPLRLVGHQGLVNAIGFLPDGRVVTGGADATLRLWAGQETVRIIKNPSAISALTILGDQVVTGGADGVIRFFDQQGTQTAEIEGETRPVLALAVSSDGSLLAAGRVGGSVTLIDAPARRVSVTLVGPGLPVWSLAFTKDGRHLLTGGMDRVIREWDVVTGEPVGRAVPGIEADFLNDFKGERGAEVFRACAACHSLAADGGNRAGPSLYGLFGRRIASRPDYAYSEPFKTLDIVWTRESVGRLFDLGPSVVTPGTKMPEQRIGNAADREALLDFLERATAAR